MLGGEALAPGNVSDREALRSSLAENFQELDGELWAADVEQVARCMRHIPDEMLERISLHRGVYVGRGGRNRHLAMFARPSGVRVFSDKFGWLKASHGSVTRC